MRVISGKAGGRRLEGPPSDSTRPMTDRVREALFSSLAWRVPDSAVLDLYAGIGSIGLEALSRGAGSVVFVERDRRVAKVLQDNVDTVGLGGKIVIQDVEAFLQGRPTGSEPFDLVFVDPPYALPLASCVTLVEQLASHMRPGAIAVLHRRSRGEEPKPAGFALEWNRQYGGSDVWRFERTESA